MDKKELGLYALLKLGVEMENDKILDIAIAALNNEEFKDTKDYKRAVIGKELFDEHFTNQIETETVVGIDNESDVVLFEEALSM